MRQRLISRAVVQPSIRLSRSIDGTATLTLASMHFAISSAVAEKAKVAKGTTADLGVIKVSLKDAVTF